jgi:5-methylcytosine-specific restriction protein A
MPTRPPVHRPPGWRPARRVRTDAIDRQYGTRAWRRVARAVVERDGGLCALCGRRGADTADHIVERRHGGTDRPSNLRAVHRGCHNRRHGGRGAPPGGPWRAV